MKRYELVSDCAFNEAELETPDGRWVKYEDADAWWQQMKELPRVQDVAEIAQLKAEAETREALLKDAYEMLGKATSEPLGVAALRALVVDRAVAYMTERDESLPALAKLGEAVAAYRAKVTEIMGPEPRWPSSDG